MLKPCVLYICSLFVAWPCVLGCEKPAPVEEVHNSRKVSQPEAAPIVVAENDWPWWRGPSRDNKAVGPEPPLQWSAQENVVWSIDVPGRGHASPVVWKDRIFIATADEEAGTQLLLAYQRSDGKLLWQTELFRDGFMHRHDKNSHASATPATDGERVYVPFVAKGALWTAAVDLDGKPVWQEESGKFNSQHGYGSSPVIYQSLVIVAGDNQGPGYLTAHDRKSGKIVWRTARGNDPSYATPVIANTGGGDRLLLSGQGDMASYDPLTGEKQWLVPGPAEVTANTVVWTDRRVFASGGYPQSAFMAFDSESGELAWQKDFKPYVVSPLEHQGRLYIVLDSGVMRCLDSDSGDEKWNKRLGGGFTSSPILWQDRIYVANEAGKVFVIQAADKFKQLAEVDMGDAIFASPVICDGNIYLRSETKLWRIGKIEAE